MPITLEELQVVLKSKSDQLRKDFKSVKKIGRDTAKDLGKSFNKIPFSKVIKSTFSMRGAFAAAAGVAGVGLLIKNSVEAADSVAKLSSNIGIQTGLLQELQFAASQTGVSQVDLNSSLLRFNRRLSEANNGNAGFKKSYDELGISIKDANGNLRAADDVLFDVADSVQSLGNESDQARVLFNLFGDSGFKLVNLFKNGSAEIRRFQKEARELGLVIGDDLLRDAEKTSDQFDILGKTLSKQVTNAILSVAPEIQKLTQLFIDGTKVTAEYVKGFSLITKEARIFRGETQSLSERQAFLIQTENELLEQREKLTKAIKEQGKSTADANLNASMRIDEINTKLGETRREIIQNTKAFREQKESVREVAQENEINLQKVKELNEVRKQAQEIVNKSTDTPQKQAQEELEILEAAKENKIQIEGDLNEAIISKREELEEFKQEKLEEEVESLRERNELLAQLGTEASEREIEQNNRVIDMKKAKVKEGTDFALSEAVREKKAQDKLRDDNLKASASFFGSIQTLAKGNSKAIFAIAKAGAIATATIDGVVAVQKALANPPGPPFSIPQAVAAGAQAAVNISRISATGFQKGIDRIPGIGGEDTVGPVFVTPGEAIINRRGNEKLEKVLDVLGPAIGATQGPNGGAPTTPNGGAPSRIVLDFNFDRAIDIIEARLVERGVLGTSLEVQSS